MTESRIFDFDTLPCIQEPDADLNAKLREDQDFICIEAKVDLGYVAERASRILYLCIPLSINDVPYSDCMVISEEYTVLGWTWIILRLRSVGSPSYESHPTGEVGTDRDSSDRSLIDSRARESNDKVAITHGDDV